MVISESSVVMSKHEETYNARNPHGLGDPDDRSLRIVEKEVLIPKIMRDRAKLEKCVPEVEEFTKCCSSSNLLMAYSCRKQNTAMQDCQTRWYKDEVFKEECKEIFLKERRDFRLTGIPKKYRLQESTTDSNNKSNIDEN